MIIELSKQDFRTVLLKMDLDKETLSLVKEERSYGEIRDSLIKNINSDNVILYRKLIKKAEEEEEEEENIYGKEDEDEEEEKPEEEYNLEDEEEQDLFELEEQQQKRRYKQLKDMEDGEANIKDENVTPMDRKLGSNKETSENKSKILKVKGTNSAYSVIQTIQNYVSGLFNLVNNLNIKVIDDKLQINRKREYDVMTQGKKNKSNQILTFLNSALNNSNFLVREYKDVLDKKGNDYVISKKTYDKENDTIKRDKRGQINVTQLQKEIQDLLNLNLPETGNNTDSKFDIIEILAQMHKETHKASPSIYRDNASRLEELTSLRRYIKGRNPSAERNLESIKNEISKLNKSLDTLQSSIKSTNELIKELENVKNKELEDLMSYRIEKINRLIRMIISQTDKIPVNERKKIQEQLTEITEEKINLTKLKENPIYIEEIKKDIIDNITKDIDRLIITNRVNIEKLKEYVLEKPKKNQISLRESLSSLSSVISKLIFIQNDMSEDLEEQNKKLTVIPKNISDSVISIKNKLHRYNRLVGKKIADFKKDFEEGKMMASDLKEGKNMTEEDFSDIGYDSTELDNKIKTSREALQENINKIVEEVNDYYENIKFEESKFR